MKTFTILLSFLTCFGFAQTPPDLTFLYQSWSWSKHKDDNGNAILTFKPTKEFGKSYGYQFKKDGTMSVSRGVSVYPESLQRTFEVVEGKWKMSEDSIIEVSYISNGYSYQETLVIRHLNALELVVHYHD